MILPTFMNQRSIQILLICGSLLVLLLTFSHISSTSISSQVTDSVKSIKNQIPHVSTAQQKFPPKPHRANSTLDFGAILYISMPSRTDRQDALSLIAGTTGLKLTMIPGVEGDSISHKAEPDGLPESLRGPVLGIWRAHANAWRYIIDNDIESALIIEDDVDWDVNVRNIFGLWNWQLRYNNTIRWGKNVERGWDEDCPYGCDWDELFMGQCKNNPNPSRLDLSMQYSDPDGPSYSSLRPPFDKELTEVWEQSTSFTQSRIISATYDPLCLQGYALSKLGALRQLYHNGGWKGIGSPVDLEIIYRTKEGKVSGYTMTPPAFTTWRVGGNKDSDNDPGMRGKEQGSTDGNVNGKSYGLRQSARKALSELLEKNYWEIMEGKGVDRARERLGKETRRKQTKGDDDEEAW